MQHGVRKAKHCRFHFNHFVTIAVRSVVDGVSKVRDIVFARTGKDLVLPRAPGQPPAAADRLRWRPSAPGELKQQQHDSRMKSTKATQPCTGHDVVLKA